jgi:uncharacterized membrane protein YsdA (DUF1294 family)/cold shock CspA family protein
MNALGFFPPLILSVRPTQKTSMRFDGNLKSWNDERGFGFIEPVHGGKDIFVHIKAFPSGSGRPSIGQALTFEVEPGPNGKSRAHSVKYPVLSRTPKPHRPYSLASWTLPRVLAIPAFVAVWIYVANRWAVKPVVLVLYIGLSLVAFLVYALDKSAAIDGRRRTPEKTLHLLGLAGGWPGALLAQQLLRHMCSKGSFVAVFWITVVVNVTVFIAWHSGLLTRV